MPKSQPASSVFTNNVKSSADVWRVRTSSIKRPAVSNTRRRSRLSVKAQRLLFLLVVMSGFGFLGGPTASAEISSERQTTWGVQTKGASSTIGSWTALAWAIEQVDNTIFIGGNYLEVTNGTTVGNQPYLAAFDADTGIWQSWFRPDVGNAVLALEASPDGGLFVGGEMGTWNGSQLGAFNKIDPTTGQTWPGWNVRAYGGTSAVRDIKLEADGWLYVVGGFTTVSSNGVTQSADGAFRLNPTTGAIDPNWIPELDGGTGWGVARSKVSNTTYIAGFFDSVNGETGESGFVGVDDAGAVTVGRDVVPYNGCTGAGYCSQMYDVETTAAGKLFVAGVEHSLYVLDETSNYDLTLHHYAGCHPGLNTSCLPVDWIGGEFQELELVGDRVYATCHCFYDMFSDDVVQLHKQPTGIHSTIDTIAAFSPTTGARLSSFRPYLSGTSGGFAIHVNESDGCLWVAGGITSYGPPDGSHLAARDVVRLCDSTGAGPTAQPDPAPPAPAACESELQGATISLSWQNPAHSAASIVERKIDDGSWNWRARLDPLDLTFSEEIPSEVSVSYRVRSKYVGNQMSDGNECGEPVSRVNNSVAPATCAVLLEGTDAEITWSAPAGASSFIVYRSLDAGQSYWRGRTDAGVLTFVDAVHAGPTFEYSVAAKDASGFLSPMTTCAPPISISGAQIQAVPSCSVTIESDIHHVNWAESSNAESYIVKRSTNAGTSHWRARIAAPSLSFDDSLIANIYFDYTVTAKAADGTKSDATDCTNSEAVVDEPVAPPTGCFITLTDDAADLVWTASADAQTTIVFRSKGDATHWRGRVDEAGTTFSDTAATPEFTYSILAQTEDGERSESTECS